MLKSTNEKPDVINERDFRQLKTTCLFGAFLSPVVTGISMSIYPGMKSGIVNSAILTAAFLIFWILSEKVGFIRKHAYNFLFTLCFLLSLLILLFAYIRNFPNVFVWILIADILASIMLLKRISHILIYLTITMGAAFLILLQLEKPYVPKYDTAALMGMFCLVAVIFTKTKLDSQCELKKSERLYRSLVEISPFSITVHRDGMITYANPAADKLALESGIGKLSGKMITEFASSCTLIMQEASSGDDRDLPTSNEYEIQLHNGAVFYLEARTIEVAHENRPALMTIFQDVTAKKSYESEKYETETRYKSLVESALVGVYLYKNHRLIYVNPYIEKLLGYSSEELFAIDLNQVIHPDDIKLIPNFENENHTESYTYQFRILKKDGGILFVETQASFLKYNGTEAIIGTMIDMSHLNDAKELIMRMAYHDVLTGLPNRYFFNEYTNTAINECKDSRRKLGIMYLDLDRFKVINDTMGHSFGDLILQEASERLNKCMRKGDIVCRHGGDEFVIILKDTGRSESVQVAKRIISSFSKPFIKNNVEVFATTSIGLSFYPEDGENVEALVKNADTAMYLAKESGKNNYQFYSSCLSEQLSRKMELENGLRKALQNDEFILHYQPQVNMETGCIEGAEALIRWHHPIFGVISPVEFIPLAEETGLINPIGEWVLEMACIRCKSWHESGLPRISISVNVSSCQLQNSDFVRTVRKVLDKTSFNPDYLVLEITESVMQDVNKTNKIVNDLKALGVKVAVDDFGIGYSSLTVLKSLNIDILKIDPSFIYDSITNASSGILVKFIIDMGHQLNCTIVAEGIENEPQAELIRQFNCDLGQGFFFSRPLTSENLENILRESLIQQNQKSNLAV